MCSKKDQGDLAFCKVFPSIDLAEVQRILRQIDENHPSEQLLRDHVLPRTMRKEPNLIPTYCRLKPFISGLTRRYAVSVNFFGGIHSLSYFFETLVDFIDGKPVFEYDCEELIPRDGLSYETRIDCPSQEVDLEFVTSSLVIPRATYRKNQKILLPPIDFEVRIWIDDQERAPLLAYEPNELLVVS